MPDFICAVNMSCDWLVPEFHKKYKNQLLSAFLFTLSQHLMHNKMYAKDLLSEVKHNKIYAGYSESIGVQFRTELY